MKTILPIRIKGATQIFCRSFKLKEFVQKKLPWSEAHGFTMMTWHIARHDNITTSYCHPMYNRKLSSFWNITRKPSNTRWLAWHNVKWTEVNQLTLIIWTKEKITTDTVQCKRKSLLHSHKIKIILSQISKNKSLALCFKLPTNQKLSQK